jgi:hypothetical protein
MSWYELLLFLHILAIATWFGSALTITAMGFMTLRSGAEAFGAFTVPATRWAGRVHPIMGVVLLLTGFGLVAEGDIDFDTWIILALIGLVVVMALGGALVGRTAEGLVKRLEGGSITAEELTADARKLLLYTRIELVILVLVIADMVAKPGA